MNYDQIIPRENFKSRGRDIGNRKLIVAVSGKNDRFGSQYSAQISGFVFARRYGLIYRFSPFFGDKDSTMASEFCGLKSDEEDDTTIEPDVFFHRKCSKAYGNIKEFFTKSAIEELRQMYHQSSKPEAIKCDVAVHIRRGDVGCIDVWGKKNADGTPYRHWLQRYDDNEYYKKAIEQIRKAHGKDVKICIFSQGRNEEFSDLIDEYITLHLNGDWRVAYHSMVKAPILVTSISEFSWTAGILSIGTVYANKRMYFNKLDHWKEIN